MREKLRVEAEKQVRLSFILDEIATREKIEVTEKDLEQKFEDIAREVKQPKERVIEYYAKEHLVEGLAVQILNQKTARFLREKAEIIAPSGNS
jgi:trigger factor